MNVHATGLVLDGAGVMLRGPSGSGKSLLALQLLEAWETRGLEAMLVSDDRLELGAADGTLTMEAPATIAGKIELRGRGILSRPFVASAPLDLVIDLVETLERMPEKAALSTEILGISLPRAPIPRAGVIDAAHQLVLVREALAAIGMSGRKTS